MAIEDFGVRLVVQGVGSFFSTMDRYNRSMDKATARTNKFGEAAGRAGRGLVALGAPIVAFATISVREAVRFDTALVGVAKTTDATVAELEGLRDTFRDLALEIPVSAGELANIGETAGRLGVAVGDIEGFVKVVADLGVATDLTTESSAQFLARIQAITQLPASEIENFSSSLVELGNNLATSESEIAAFALRMAGVGTSAGIAQDELLGIAGSFSELGIRAERGGTAVQKVLFTMIGAVAQAGPELDKFAETAGVTSSEFAQLFEEDAAEAFTRFVEGLGRSGDDAFVILEELGLADQRLAQAFITVASAGDNLRENIELSSNAFEKNTALTIEAERRYASAAAQFGIFKNNVIELAIAVGDVLVPPLIEITKALIPIITNMAAFAEAHPTLTKLVVGLGIALVAFGSALIVLGFLVPAAVAGFGILTGAIGLLSGAFAFLTIAMGPISLIIIGIAAAIAAGILIWKNWDTIIEFIKEKVNGFIEVLNTLIRVIFKLNPLLAGLDALGLISTPQIPTFGHGGTMGRSGPAIVGERGPEMVSLPAGAQVTPIASSNEINVTAHYANPQEPNSIRSDMEFVMMGLQS